MGAATLARPLVILAVENERTRAAYAYGLVAAGFEVTTAGAAAPRTQGCRPHIIVADVSAGPPDDWMRVQCFRRDARTRGVPIVALAGDVGAGTRDRARREGCAAVCLNTCPADVLASGLRAVLDQTQVAQAAHAAR